MTKKEKIKRIAFAFERIFMINPSAFDIYQARFGTDINPAVFNARNRTLLMDIIYAWARIFTIGVIGVNFMRRNYALKSYLKILAGYLFTTQVVPYTYYNLLEFNRMRLLKREAAIYYNLYNGKMDKIELILNPHTPVSKLRYLSL